MLPNVVEHISHHPLTGTDAASLEQWRRTCEASWNHIATDFLTEEESTYGSSLLTTFMSAYADLASLVAAKQHATEGSWTESARRASIESLVNRPQIEQRTEAWYLDAAGLLSASQFSVILKPGRTRALLVMEKAAAQPPDTSNRRTVVTTAELNPFTWGIRFEPVVKQIYEHLTRTKLTELGRLRHATDNRLAASPDGLVVEGPPNRLGRFVEFKAPVTRPILDKVPDDYMTQMQIQMEVGQVEECDYLEVKFQSLYGSKPLQTSIDEPTFKGVIYLIAEKDGEQLLRYEYSRLNDTVTLPQIQANEEIRESIPWWCSQWYMTTVGRSRDWFASVQPFIQSFWKDVALAKEGAFSVPASTRKPREAKCMIRPDQDQDISQDLVQEQQQEAIAELVQ